MSRSPRDTISLVVWLLAATACGGARSAPGTGVPPDVTFTAPSAAGGVASSGALRPAIPPQLARIAGLMPLRSLGIDEFLRRHPTYDGRGVLIAVLDGGIDPGLPGLARTSADQAKLVDVWDFSGEGRVVLAPVEPGPDGTVGIEGRQLSGVGRLSRLAAPPYYGGVFRELPLGQGAAADLNGDGDQDDVFPLVVGRASDGWVVTADTDGDGSLANERAIHDFAVAGETLAWGRAPMTVAVKFAAQDGRPVLDLFFDNSSHGTHVAGIAAGHNLFGVEGFDGVAPGAQVLALKIADNGRGKISVTGSMERALRYAAEFAERRQMPLVVNLSYGVGNEVEGTATIDSIVNAFALRHPEHAVVVSAGNEGPGVSTLGFPASADHAIAVCALLPGVFARPPDPDLPVASDVIGWWSARGGEVAKPDVCAPGVAFSNVPPWRTGEEISAGTSMAAPQVAGALALLLSAMRQEGRRVRASDLRQSLTATAAVVPGATVIDMGAGIPRVGRAYDWLRAAHQGGGFVVRALGDGGNTSHASGAYRRTGLESSGDTVQRFRVTPVAGQSSARLLLRSDATWIRAPAQIELRGEPVEVALTYDARRLTRPGLYVGSVWARAATDTLAGPVFRLTNTVVVPRPLETPFDTTADLGAGELERFFFAVPDDADGLRVELAVDAEASATLYLFEPDGQPYRGGSQVDTHSPDGIGEATATVEVTAETLRPGVYEVVVASPPVSETAYRLRAELPGIGVERIATGPTAVLRNRGPGSGTASVSGDLVGATKKVAIVGRGREPQVLPIDIPSWARDLVVDVAIAPGLWSRVTDFGVTLYDDRGRPVADGPLNHSFGRLTFPLDSTHVGRRISIELFPAFAVTQAPSQWEAQVTVTLHAHEPVPLTLLHDADPTVNLAAGESTGLQFAPGSLEGTYAADGFELLVRVTAEPEVGAASVRVGAWVR